MYELVFLDAPFALATVLSVAWPRTGRRWRGLFGLGIMLAVAFVLYVYLSAPPDQSHDNDQCNHCQQFLGRWWEPVFVVWLVVVGYFAWSVGIALGAGLRGLVSLLWRRVTPSGGSGSRSLLE